MKKSTCSLCPFLCVCTVKIGNVCKKQRTSLGKYNGLHAYAWNSLVLEYYTDTISIKVTKVYFEVGIFWYIISLINYCPSLLFYSSDSVMLYMIKKCPIKEWQCFAFVLKPPSALYQRKNKWQLVSTLNSLGQTIFSKPM